MPLLSSSVAASMKCQFAGCDRSPLFHRRDHVVATHCDAHREVRAGGSVPWGEASIVAARDMNRRSSPLLCRHKYAAAVCGSTSSSGLICCCVALAGATPFFSAFIAPRVRSRPILAGPRSASDRAHSRSGFAPSFPLLHVIAVVPAASPLCSTCRPLVLANATAGGGHRARFLPYPCQRVAAPIPS